MPCASQSLRGFRPVHVTSRSILGCWTKILKRYRYTTQQGLNLWWCDCPSRTAAAAMQAHTPLSIVCHPFAIWLQHKPRGSHVPSTALVNTSANCIFATLAESTGNTVEIEFWRQRGVAEHYEGFSQLMPKGQRKELRFRQLLCAITD